MTRVWLTRWEWDCCGDAFTVGDEIDFGIETRDPDPTLADMLGPALVSTVDAIESHHEEDRDDRVRGRVVAVHTVTHEVIEHRSLRRPGHGAPPDAIPPSEGDEWPLAGRELGKGVFEGSRPSRYLIEVVSVPDTAALLPARGVRLPEAEPAEPLPPATRPAGDPPPERRARAHAGWLVDVEEQ